MESFKTAPLLITVVLLVGCVPDFEEVNLNAPPPADTDIGTNGGAGSTTSGDASVARMNPDDSPNQLGWSPEDDRLTFFGGCRAVVGQVPNLLRNDPIPEPIRSALMNQVDGYAIEIEQPAEGWVFIEQQRVIYEPNQLVETTFTYRINTPNGRSGPAVVSLELPEPHVVVDPDAADLVDDGQCSLREAAIAIARPESRNDCGEIRGDTPTIIFSNAGTVRLGRVEDDAPDLETGDIDLTRDVRIVGCGDELTASGLPQTNISGGDTARVFEVHANARVRMSQLMISKGRAAFGAGILNRGALQLVNVTFFANEAVGEPGGDGRNEGGCGGGGGGAALGGALLTTQRSQTEISATTGRCLFQQNTAIGGQGGGWYAPSIEDVDFECGGRGGGPEGGDGGQANRGRVGLDGANGGPFSGGGGGVGSFVRGEAGRGGRGGFGAGGGCGGNTPSSARGDDGRPGAGGFGGGSGAAGPLDTTGGGGGGGAGLGGAIAALGGQVEINNCLFVMNAARGGEGGGVTLTRTASMHGQAGRAYGADLFSIGNLITVSRPDELDWTECDRVMNEPGGQCGDARIPPQDD